MIHLWALRLLIAVSQKLMCQQGIRSLAQVLEWQTSPFSNIEQAVLAVGIIQHPEHRHLPRTGMLLTANDTIQAAFA
jgi:hypothetical protein